MTQAEVITLIQTWIIANANEEITADVLRPILEAMVNQPNDLIGDLGDLTTTYQTDLVGAINEINALIDGSGLVIYTGSDLPDVHSFPTVLTPADFYVQLDGSTVSGMWVYNGNDWIAQVPQRTKTVKKFVSLVGVTVAGKSQVQWMAEAINLNISNGVVYECEYGDIIDFFVNVSTSVTVDAASIRRIYTRLCTGATSVTSVVANDLMPDGSEEIPLSGELIVELEDIGTDDVWDAFNADPSQPFDMDNEMFVSAVQDSEPKLWQWIGGTGSFGSTGTPSVEADFLDLTEQPTVPIGQLYDPYTNISSLLSSQLTQSTETIIRVLDASADTNITFPIGETKLWAYYQYLGTPNGLISDYRLVSVPYGNHTDTKDALEVATVSATKAIDWRITSFEFTLTDPTTFTDSFLPATGYSKEIALLVTGDVATFPSYWKIGGDAYDSTKFNFIRVRYNSDSGKVYGDNLTFVGPIDYTGLPYGGIIVESANPIDEFIGSPFPFKSSTGRYFYTHDHFGAGTTYQSSGLVSVYYTDDLTETFIKSADVSDMFWATIFEYGSDLYLLGTQKQYGTLQISKSTDDGLTWSTPVTVLGVVSTYLGWHKTSSSIVIKDGYLVVSVEVVNTSGSWAAIFNSCLVFADLTDLTNPLNWDYSNILAFNGTAFVNEGIWTNTNSTKYPPVGGQSVAKGMLEGSIVELASGDLRVFMRVEQTPTSNRALYFDITWDAITPTNSTIDTTPVYIQMPGGNVGFNVVYDSTSSKLWSVTNVNRFKNFADNRIEAFLISSSDGGLTWTVHQKAVGFTTTASTWEADIVQVGLQYNKILIDGNNLLIATRTADENAVDWHNSNLGALTLIENFRDSVSMGLVDGALILDENCERLEDLNGIAVIFDRSKGLNSPFMSNSDNASKVFWSAGLDFTGSEFMRAIHDPLLNLDTGTGLSIYVVIENLQGAGGGERILSKSVGGSGVTDLNAKDYAFSVTGLKVQTCFYGYTDYTVGNNYIVSSGYDNVNNRIYNVINGVSRGAPSTISGGSYVSDYIQCTNPYTIGNYAELLIGKRSYTASPLNFNSKIKAIHIIPSFDNIATQIAYQNALNAIYSIY